ncbi:hypothetical protein TrLO_g13321 [Triparma laevis f. longispina]|uniref:Serine aminopeptidase S33 domain-containing protein n=2 Tax=Triparma laevis TaxID=1534972 RepID=A0A9W7FTF8_9STRA|nr:hypothetical protein TrLO_g13321 [Triparma laevis f. longispina]
MGNQKSKGGGLESRPSEDAINFSDLDDIEYDQNAAIQAREEIQRRNSQNSQNSTSTPDQPRRPSYYTMAKQGYNELVKAIIRPPRASYDVESLGPPSFKFAGQHFVRTDFQLNTLRGLRLECSHWEPVMRVADQIPCVIYLHGNSSGRPEAVGCLSYLLSLGVSVFAFDFAGSGLSEGDHVSLGYYEREDLQCVINHLRATNVVSTVALWGRSMGAATALMHGDRDPSIACMVCDSAFSDLTTLAEEMVEKGREQGLWAPNLLVSVAIRMINGSVKKMAKFNIKDISPISHAAQCFIPCLFVAGEDDNFILPSHSEAIHKAYAGDKNIIIVDGDHNSPRPQFMFDSACIFLKACLQLTPENTTPVEIEEHMNLLMPPWYLPGREKGIGDFLRQAFVRGSTPTKAESTPPHPPPNNNSNSTPPTSNNPTPFDGANEVLFSDMIEGMDMNKAGLGVSNERQQNINDNIANMFGGKGEDKKSTLKAAGSNSNKTQQQQDEAFFGTLDSNAITPTPPSRTARTGQENITPPPVPAPLAAVGANPKPANVILPPPPPQEGK